MVNAPEFFLSHRLPLALAAQKFGYEVHVATANGPDVEKVREYGFFHYTIPFARSGQNPIRELKTILFLTRLFRAVKPDLVHLITIKPVLYGGISARIVGIKSVVAAVSGLGTVFLASSIAAKLRRWLVTFLYSTAFKQKRLTVIFQNPDDRDTLLELGVVRSTETFMIRGSGVDLADYPYVPEPVGTPVVVMAARLLKDKGTLDYIEASRLLHQRGTDLKMRLIGSPDPGNPTTVTQHELDAWACEGTVELLGYRKDIADQYAAANVVCLPSYREGLPKSLIEAAACGRAVVTTDVPGCRDAIIPDVTGLLVPIRNASLLADAIQKLVEEPELRERMGRAGRRLAEDAFTIENIVAQHMSIYQEHLEQ
ncbi:glycosyltransferase involved in cell wall biosynthesis [Marinobacterium halophilum]|uniref:Glycosyltransferase involved in cell wall biosynthesis n=1 Tax=Marinobacterium halophilum TaxID=267374 RepID=A0A2P8ETY1_9GAMM|nr:glycosyltransferase family 4 protein [Marinobacterium halophilum]PSL12937.1 glycosyltransferase involved in cell wall biosynthesis [Marinobacterium halophilum]